MQPHATQRPASTARLRVRRVTETTSRAREEVVATEEPLEIRVNGHSVAVTMRTPGNDFELAAGFLFTEGVVATRDQIRAIRYCADPQNYNVVTVELAAGVTFDRARLTRHVFTSSSCGICGKASLEALRVRCSTALEASPPLPADFFLGLPATLRREQSLFAQTGGLHAAALFDYAGRLLLLREDVGRHNALDKLIGALLLKGQLPARQRAVLVSGRASFELAQKAVQAGIPVFVSVGAPSSLAVALAREWGMRLVGFIREGRYNVYAD